jgi:hypothetical protein
MFTCHETFTLYPGWTCALEWVEKGLFSKSHLYLWFSLNLIFSKNFCILFFFFNFSWPTHKAAENFVIWPKTDHFGHFYQERYLLDDFLLIQNWFWPKCYEKTLEPKPWSWPYDRGGHEYISIFDDFNDFSLVELRFSWLFHLKPLYLS